MTLARRSVRSFVVPALAAGERRNGGGDVRRYFLHVAARRFFNSLAAVAVGASRRRKTTYARGVGGVGRDERGGRKEGGREEGRGSQRSIVLRLHVLIGWSGVATVRLVAVRSTAGTLPPPYVAVKLGRKERAMTPRDTTCRPTDRPTRQAPT